MCVVNERFGEMTCMVVSNGVIWYEGGGGWWVKALSDMVELGGYIIVV